MTTQSPALPAQSSLGSAGVIAAVPETAVAAAAAQAKAEVEAAYIVAMQRPRDMMAVRAFLLADCQRTGFAEAAVYRLPRKKWDPVARTETTETITGPSVRFAEAALRALKNVRVSSVILFENESQRVCRVTVVDLEANTPLSADFVVAKTVERKKLLKNQSPIETRTGSDGSTVYIVAASESDVTMKQNAAASRVRRNLIVQLLPADILEEALDAIEATAAGEQRKDPAAFVKKLVDGFARLGVSVQDLAKYLGCNVDKASPEALAELRALGVAISQGETTWEDAVAAKAGSEPEDPRIREAIIRAVTSAQVSHPAAVVKAMADAGIHGGADLSSLSLDQLRAVDAAMKGAK